ncbi:MAG: glucose-1-phosphate thymidylyltransferase RfbA [Rickettsiales bacterium]|nr:glucose-1-phosphate thymidylyltransferase RfbA [Rickettsiales bacterium]
MKGIILAGGSGTRLAPLTNVISKQLLPVYDKPMICYPLSTLISLNIKEILIISTPHDIKNIENFLGDGSDYGLKLEYTSQAKPNGIAEAFLIGENFIGNENVCLILGDNIFYGSEISQDYLKNSIKNIGNECGAYVFAYHVSDPERYGVVEFAKDQETAISIEEKPKNPKSNWALTGLYFYDNDVVKFAKELKPSARGELEITDLNQIYLSQNKLGVIKLKRGFAWLDAGTPDSLLEASNFIHTIEKRQGLKVACLEEICYQKNFITLEKLQEITARYKKGSAYHQYLESVASNN